MQPSFSTINGSQRRTLDALFRHPSAHNLEWNDVVSLMGKIGDSYEKPNSEFVFEVGGKHHLMRRPHTKDLTSVEVMELRHFLTEAGFSPDHSTQPEPAVASLLVVMDHHGARIFHVDVSSDEVSQHVITPYDPHHFLHHLTHKDQSRERGQRTPEEPAYYEQIAASLANGGKIVVVGHGFGKSNAAHHLIAHLKSHHTEIFQNVVREIGADLSAITTPQLLNLARDALHD